MTRWQWQYMTMTRGQTYLTSWRSVVWNIIRIFTKSFTYLISPFFTPLFGLDNGWNMSLHPRSGKRTYDELSTEVGEERTKASKSCATFFLKKWYPDFGLFWYNYIKRGDALPSSCLRRAFAPKVDKKASAKRNHHPSYPHLSSFQKSLKYFRRAQPSRNKSGKLSIMHFFCISFVFCFGFV